MQNKTVNKLQKIVSRNNGEIILLANTASKLSSFKCKRGHKFSIRAKSILSKGIWCKYCSNLKRIKKTERNLKRKVRDLKGSFLSELYEGTQGTYKFLCDKGHTFSLKGTDVLHRNLWCSLCKTASKKRKNYDKLALVAKNRGGVLLSTKFNLVADFYELRCDLGHEFSRRAIDIFNGKWCPDCSKYLTERLCREVMSSIFGCDFPSAAPSWLVSKKGQLQLDGFNAKGKIAFEYNGIQHYEFNPLYHKTIEDFTEQQKRDSLKKDLCKEHGILLVEIPTYRARNYRSIKAHVIEACEAAGISFSKKQRQANINLSKAYSSKDGDRIEALNALLKTLDGRLISYQGGKCFVACNKCKNEWCVSYATLINRKSWCRICSGNHKKDLRYIQKLAKNKNGLCLATEYTNMMTKVPWKCHVTDHPIWYAKSNSIKMGRWCPRCKADKASKRMTEVWRLKKQGL